MLIFILNKKPRQIALFLSVIMCLLIISSTVLGLMIASIGKDEASTFLREIFSFVDLNGEKNLASLFSSFLWLLAGIFSLYTVKYLDRNTRQFYFWTILGTIFVYFAIDEWLALHEQVGRFTAEIFTSLDFGTFSWLIPGSIVILVLAMFFLLFMNSIPPDTIRLILIGFLIFIIGAMGFEVLGAYAARYYGGRDNATFRILAQLEEMFEMIGVIIIIFAINLYLRVVTNYFIEENKL